MPTTKLILSPSRLHTSFHATSRTAAHPAVTVSNSVQREFNGRPTNARILERD